MTSGTDVPLLLDAVPHVVVCGDVVVAVSSSLATEIGDPVDGPDRSVSDPGSNERRPPHRPRSR